MLHFERLVARTLIFLLEQVITEHASKPAGTEERKRADRAHKLWGELEEYAIDEYGRTR